MGNLSILLLESTEQPSTDTPRQFTFSRNIFGTYSLLLLCKGSKYLNPQSKSEVDRAIVDVC